MYLQRLAEFENVVDAVNCAVEIQRDLAERNAESPAGRKMEFRIGVNLGDVIEKKDRIYGDGVNIAARVESLAEAGGICISGTAYDQVKRKLGLQYEYLGEQTVKNIDKPVRVYRVLSVPGAAAHRVVRAKRGVERKWRRRMRGCCKNPAVKPHAPALPLTTAQVGSRDTFGSTQNQLGQS